ncbi:MAG: response regulator [Acidobacteriia bacterium]|nr:response regulator [Terriglobia bacterium]
MVTIPGCILLPMSERPAILVVDDEPSVLLTYSMILRHSGYRVIGVATAREAKVVLAEERFDMLVCDLALEGRRSGLEVLDFARARYPGIPAVLLTGYADRELGEETERKRITLLSKPIEVKDLLDTIGGLARKQSA